MTRKTLTIIGLFCLLGTTQLVAQTEKSDSEAGKIMLKGHIDPSCYIHVNGKTREDLVFENNETESKSITLTSFCNNESRHNITINSGLALKADDTSNSSTIPYKVTVGNENVQKKHTLTTNGLNYEGTIFITLEDTVVPAGEYKDTVVFTITHGS